jgi:alpha-beta hydrolase superfamily lysophospholipase
LEAFSLDSANNKSTHNESLFNIEGSNGNQLRIVSWFPPKMKTLIVLVHGLGDHMLRYRSWALLFNQESIGVIGADLRGHGKSDGQRGNGTCTEFTGDIHAVLKFTHEQYPFVPKILYGHSMGGNLVLRYIIDYKPNILGVIATSPWLKLHNPPNSFMLKIVSFLYRFLPVMPLSNGIKSKDISHNPEIVKLYQIDPLIHNHMTPKLFFSINESGLFILKNKHKINIPLLIMHGSGDKITSHKASSGFANLTSDKTTFKIWKGAYHELHHEFERKEIFYYILRWIERISST